MRILCIFARFCCSAKTDILFAELLIDIASYLDDRLFTDAR